jgi:1,4-alpha-glucan branching enzyme
MSKHNRKNGVNGKSQAPRLHEVEFILETASARRVLLAGDFNGWGVNDLPLREESPGRWRTRVALPPGTHQYRFIVDGQWVDDPRAGRTTPNSFGSCNCEVEVQ